MSCTKIDDNGDGNYDNAIFYSYDIHGNVKEMLTDFPELAGMGRRAFRTRYVYDLVSGKVREVQYQKGEADQFFHRYTYDKDDRLTEVHTSRDGVIWERDAKYRYYGHGPLMKQTTGDLQVQGTDYAYTLQGWLKGVNSSMVSASTDMGADGLSFNALDPSKNIARDAHGFTLNYFNHTSGSEDYQPIDPTYWASTNRFETKLADASFYGDIRPLYNGNISAMVTGIPDDRHLSTLQSTDANAGNYAGNYRPFLSAYRYDQLNRIRSADYYKASAANISGNNWTGTSVSSDYRNTYTYDANGNIETLSRNAFGTSLAMDQLSYSYKNGTNQLDRVEDPILPLDHTVDIDGQLPLNYLYYPNGELKRDLASGIDTIGWTAYGKVKHIRYNTLQAPVEYRYNALRQRVMKIIKNPSTSDPLAPQFWTYEYYVRDAQGNVLAVYDYHYYGSKRTYMQGLDVYQADNLTETLKLLEWDLYGSSRVGTYNLNEVVASKFTSRGTCLSCPVTNLTPGSLQISRLLYDSPLQGADSTENHIGEWFSITNTTNASIKLDRVSVKNENGAELHFPAEQWIDSAQTLFLLFGDPVDIQIVSVADLMPRTLLLAANTVHLWQKSLPLPDSSGSVSIVYNPPVGNSVLIDKVSYGPGKIEASNESVAESNIDLPFRPAVELIEKTVMNSSGTSTGVVR